LATRNRVPEDTVAKVQDLAEAERAAKAARDVFAGDIDVAKSDTAPQGLNPKLLFILQNIRKMEKDGYNKFHKYAYYSDDQVSSYFRHQFAQLGILMFTNVVDYDLRDHATKSEGSSILTTIRFRFTLVDVATGEFLEFESLGQGDDPNDKGSNKAMTGAVKYFLLKLFMIGGDDAEADQATDTRSYSNEPRNVKIEGSTIEGIGRGGRANHATDVQVRQIRELAKDLGWNAEGAARRMSEWLGLPELDLSETDPQEQGPALIKWLDSLSSDQAGTIVTKMVELKEQPDVQEEDGDSSVSG